MCADLVANYKKRLTSVIANKGFATKYEVMFCKDVKYLFYSIQYFSGFFVVILSLTVKINLSLKSLMHLV